MLPPRSIKQWFQRYEQHRASPRILFGAAICVLVVIVGAAVLMEQAKVPIASHQPDRPRIKFM